MPTTSEDELEEYRQFKIRQLGKNWEPGVTVVTDLLTFPQCVQGFDLEKGYEAKLKILNEYFENEGLYFVETDSSPLSVISYKNYQDLENEINKRFQSLNKIDRTEQEKKEFNASKQKIKQEAQKMFLKIGTEDVKGEPGVAYKKFMRDRDSVNNRPTLSPKTPTANFFFAIGLRLDESVIKGS